MIDASHPTRDGWIEMLKPIPDVAKVGGPIPHGMGGLKLPLVPLQWSAEKSHPTRDGWIEITSLRSYILR